MHNSTLSPFDLLSIGDDGIVRDYMGFPIPMSQVKQLIKTITETYWDMSPEQLQQEYELRLRDFPSMHDQTDMSKVDLS